MSATSLERLKTRLAAARADVEGKASAHELELALEEIEALWDELHLHADRLARERERNTTLFDRAPFACVLTDGYGSVREANLAAIALLDVPASYAIGKPFAIFFTDAERGAFRRTLARAADRSALVEGWNSELKSPSNRTSSVHVDVRPLPARPDEPVLLFWFLHSLDRP